MGERPLFFFARLYQQSGLLQLLGSILFNSPSFTIKGTPPFFFWGGYTTNLQKKHASTEEHIITVKEFHRL